MSDSGSSHFHWADYVVFVLSLVTSAGIGVFYGWRDRKKNTIDHVLMAGKNMAPIPVGVSIFVSMISAISFLADPMEVYRYGIIGWFLSVGYCLALPFAAHLTAPAFYKMNIISVNEYLEIRFNKYLRVIIPIIRSFTSLVYMAVALLAPSLALSQVADLEVWMSIIITGLVCSFYTSLGGLKAVLWADTLQCSIMMAGLLAVLIQATIDLGGLGPVWRAAQDGGRINFDKVDPNPLQHATVWTYLAGGFFRIINGFSGSQSYLQRYNSLPCKRDVIIAVYVTLPLFFLFGCTTTLTGLVLYAYYRDCDPLLDGRISASDQMLPLLTMDVLSHLPGVPGLFIACIFSACMSTLSTSQSAMASYWLKDFVMPLHVRCSGRNISETVGAFVSKFIALMLGLATIGLAFLLLEIEDPSLFQMTNIITGSFGSPIAGIFLTGLLFSCVGNVAIIVGLLFSLTISMWLGIGSFLYPSTEGQLPVNIDGCPNHNESLWTTVSASPRYEHFDDNGFSFTDIYKFSSLLSYLLGSLLTALGALTVTAVYHVFCGRRRRASDEYRVSQTSAQSKQDFKTEPILSATTKLPTDGISNHIFSINSMDEQTSSSSEAFRC